MTPNRTDRTAGLTSQEAAAQVGGVYDMILIASTRARELRSGHAPQVTESHGVCVTAMLEIEQGKVGRDYLLKPSAQDNQRQRRRYDRRG
jgi:DNA-directed RNA polymerase subunit K/omega